MKEAIKNKFTTIALIISFLSLTNINIAQNVGINTTGAAPDNSALLDLSSVNRGFLITRVDTINITAPAFGLMTLSPSDSCLYIFGGPSWISLGGVGEKCTCNGTPIPTFPCAGTVMPIVEVTNPTTGKIWLDRNLGASRAATSGNDSDAYGDLYQWGRCSDGHEKRNSGTTPTLSSTSVPTHSDFILGPSAPRDWLSPQNDNLWQGVTGINNPCPTGYRIPTSKELDDERKSWNSNSAAGAFNSPLKFTVAGHRNRSLGSINYVDQSGFYWSSTVAGTNTEYLDFYGPPYSNSSEIGRGYRATGASIRCIKD